MTRTIIVLALAFCTSFTVAAATPTLSDQLAQSATALSAQPKGGVLIVRKRGKLIYAHAFGAWPESDITKPYLLFSVSKSFAAAAAMILAQDAGADFQLSDPISKHLPALADVPAASKITVRHLLSMTSGLPRHFPKDSCVGDRHVTLEVCAAELIGETLRNPGSTSPPGSVHEYSGSSWTVLGAAMVAAYNRGHQTHLSYAQLLDKLLFNRCGWGAVAFQGDGPEASNNVWVGGGIVASAQTGANLAELLRTGRCENGSVLILRPSALHEMRRNQTAGSTTRNSAYAFSPAKVERSYGLGLFRSDYPGAPYPALLVGPGALGSHLLIDPHAGYSAFMLLNDGAGGFQRGDKLLDEVLPLIEDLGRVKRPLAEAVAARRSMFDKQEATR